MENNCLYADNPVYEATIISTGETVLVRQIFDSDAYDILETGKWCHISDIVINYENRR